LQDTTSVIESLKEENDLLNDKNKKWLSKLDNEIEKNAENVGTLILQIKELSEKNFKLEFENK
jgi:FtsZ-binding cell division protein ZapB